MASRLPSLAAAAGIAKAEVMAIAPATIALVNLETRILLSFQIDAITVALDLK
ncbi:MAG: hypothetical protein V7761_06905 [Amylibacter sp.]